MTKKQEAYSNIFVFMQNVQNIPIFMQYNLVLCKKIKILNYLIYV